MSELTEQTEQTEQTELIGQERSSILFRDVYLYDAAAGSGMTGPTDLLVAGREIAAIGSAARSSATDETEIIQGCGHHLIVPGLINAHFHSPANHLKGSLPSLPLELFMLYESPLDAELAPTPREVYLRTMLAAMEMLKTGTTSVQDDAFLMPHPSEEVIDAVMQAYADCGIRASVALDQPELAESAKLPYLGSIEDALLRRSLDSPAPMGRAELLEHYRYLIERWNGAHNGRLTAAVSVSAPQRVSAEYFEALNELSAKHSIPLFAHMLETKVQRALASEQPRFQGRSLVEYTSDLGLLDERTNVIHAVWTSARDLQLIAEAGSTIAHNPVSNLRLGSGVAPYRMIKDLGIPVALGIDEAICDDSANMWGVVKMTGLIHNISGADSESWPSAAEVLQDLWEGGATSLLKAGSLGRVEPGYLADLAMLDLHTAAFTPLNDLRGQLVYCESGTSVRLTVVNGRIVFRDGALTGVDEESILDESRELFARKLPSIRRARDGAKAVHSQYQAIVAAAAAADLGMNRWIQHA